MKVSRADLLRWLAAAAITLMLLLLPWFIITTPNIPAFAKIWWSGQADDFTGWKKNVDAIFLQANPNPNLATVFRGFDPANPKDGTYAQGIAFRGQYAIYPRRLVFAEAGVPIGNGKEILQAKFDPSVPWLQGNDIGEVLYFSIQDQTTPVMVRGLVPPREPASPEGAGR